MQARLLLTLVFVLSLPSAVFADMGPLPLAAHDFVFEMETDVPGYCFWFVNVDRVEPLDLTPGRHAYVYGGDRARFAFIVAAPVGLMEEMGTVNFLQAHRDHKLPPSVSQSSSIDLYDDAPFLGTATRVDRYRVEFQPGQPIRLVEVPESPWVGGAKVVGGVLLASAITWGGYRILRRRPRVVGEQKSVA
jgi:hypothetical protein